MITLIMAYIAATHPPFEPDGLYIVSFFFDICSIGLLSDYIESRSKGKKE